MKLAYLLALIPSLATADPDSYLAPSAAAGVGNGFDGAYATAGVEGGHRVGDSLWVHGRLSEIGRIGGDPDQGALGTDDGQMEGVVGLGWRGCTTRAVCLIGGFDIGGRAGASNGFAQLLASGNGGFDVGGDHLRLRSTIEIVDVTTHHDSDSVDFKGHPLGIGVRIAVAYQW